MALSSSFFNLHSFHTKHPIPTTASLPSTPPSVFPLPLSLRATTLLPFRKKACLPGLLTEHGVTRCHRTNPHIKDGQGNSRRKESQEQAKRSRNTPFLAVMSPTKTLN